MDEYGNDKKEFSEFMSKLTGVIGDLLGDLKFALVIFPEEDPSSMLLTSNVGPNALVCVLDMLSKAMKGDDTYEVKGDFLNFENISQTEH